MFAALSNCMCSIYLQNDKAFLAKKKEEEKVNSFFRCLQPVDTPIILIQLTLYFCDFAGTKGAQGKGCERLHWWYWPEKERKEMRMLYSSS